MPLSGNDVSGGAAATAAAANVVSVQSSKVPELDYGSTFMVDDSQLERLEGVARPVNESTVGDGPFLFVIPESGQHDFLNMGSIMLYLRAKITKKDGSNLEEADIVAPVNGLISCMWEKVLCWIGNDQIGLTSSSNNHYKAYIETMLSYDFSAFETHLAAQGFARNDAKAFQDFSGDKESFSSRRSISKESRQFELVGPVNCDFIKSSKFLGPGHKLQLEFHRANNQFCIDGGDYTKAATAAVGEEGVEKIWGLPVPSMPYQLHVLELKLYYSHVRMKSTTPSPRIERHLITSTRLTMYPEPINSTSIFLNISEGRIPKTIVVGLVRTLATQGHLALDPFYFNHYNIKRFWLDINGKSYPQQGFDMDFSVTPPKVLRAYRELQKQTGNCWHTGQSNCVGLRDFQDGLTLFAVDTNPDNCSGAHLHASQTGTVNLHMEFAEACPHPVTVLVYTSFDDVVIIHESGKVTVKEV